MTKSKSPQPPRGRVMPGKTNTPPRTGGGIGMRQNVKTGVKAGPPSTAKIDPRHVAAIGAKRGDHSEYHSAKNVDQVPPRVMGTAPQVALGNDLAKNVGRGGPGTGRTVHKSGSQSTWGAPNPGNPQSVPSSHPISEFGPKGK